MGEESVRQETVLMREHVAFSSPWRQEGLGEILGSDGSLKWSFLQTGSRRLDLVKAFEEKALKTFDAREPDTSVLTTS